MFLKGLLEMGGKNDPGARTNEQNWSWMAKVSRVAEGNIGNIPTAASFLFIWKGHSRIKNGYCTFGGKNSAKVSGAKGRSRLMVKITQPIKSPKLHHSYSWTYVP